MQAARERRLGSVRIRAECGLLLSLVPQLVQVLNSMTKDNLVHRQIEYMLNDMAVVAAVAAVAAVHSMEVGRLAHMSVGSWGCMTVVD